MSAMRRVSTKSPCPVCKKPDWCLLGKDVALCMRVTSSRVKSMADGSVGYIHAIDGTPLPDYKPRRDEVEKYVTKKDFRAIMEEWYSTFGLDSLQFLSKQIGVTRQSLELLGCRKCPQVDTWGFPMMDGAGAVIGIRLRHIDGAKWAYPSSNNGLFIPSCPVSKTMAIVEGPTDVAAALTIGLYAIGRFNNCGGANMIIDFIKRNKISRVMVVADCDQDRIHEQTGQVMNPGISGAMNLAKMLPVPSCTVTLPCKDMRAFVKGGGTVKVFNAITSQLVWEKGHK